MNASRLARLERLLHPSAWRFLFLTATDPALDRLYSVLRHEKRADLARHPFPRFTVPAVEYLGERLRDGSRVLEWGAGFSTIWFKNHGCVTNTVEHDPGWHATVRSHIEPPSWIELRAVGPAYATPVESITDYDAIVIDGRMREKCARFVAGQIRNGLHKPGTMVVFDDTNRPRYRDAVRELRSLAADQETFAGTSTTVLDKLTTIFSFA